MKMGDDDSVEVRLSQLKRESDALYRSYERVDKWSTALMVVGLGVAFVAFGTSFFLNRNNSPSNTDKLQSQVVQLDARVKSLEGVLNKPGQNVATQLLNDRVNGLDTKLQDLDTTILADPDKAITARLLRDEQKNVEAQMTDLKNDNATTRQYVMYLGGTVIAVPVLTMGIERFLRKRGT